MYSLARDRLHPDYCITSANTPISRDQFLAHASGAQAYLRSQGDRIALCIDDAYWFSVAVFSCLSLGKEPCVLPNHKPDTLSSYTLEFDSIVRETDLTHLHGETRSMEIPAESRITFFTSGSSGSPKRIQKRFRHLLAEVEELERTFGSMVGNCSFLATVTHRHIYGFLFRLLWPTLSGRTYFSATLEYPEQIECIASRIDAFTLVSSPAFLKRYFGPGTGPRPARAVFSSGGMLDYSAAQLCRSKLGTLPVEVYGSTESGGVAHRTQTRADSLWSFFSTVERVPRSDNRLEIRSPYFDAPSMILGDTVEVAGNEFHLRGRSDDIVKIEEKRVSLTEISHQLMRSPWIKDCVVVALEVNHRQQTACLAVLTSEGKKAESEKGLLRLIQVLQAHLREELENIVVPRKFRFVEEIPYNSQSKITRESVLRYFNEC